MQGLEAGREGALRKAAEAVGADAARMLEDLRRLVAVDTSFPPGAGYGAMADLLTELLEPLGITTRRVEVPRELWDPGTGDVDGPRVNLIAARRAGHPVCSLYFHVDTVPAGDGWTRPPFSLTLEEGRVYGRGTADMKGTIAAVLAALRAAAAAGLGLAFDPVLLFCTDEEGGLYPGIRWLAEQGLIEGHLLSFNGQAAPRIWAGCFGSLDLRIEVVGQAAHSGDGTGINAIEEAVPLLQALLALKARVEGRTSALAPPPGRERPLHARLTIAAAHGGAKGSALPGRFTVLVNRRYAPEEDPDAVLAELESAVAEALRPTRALGFSTRIVGHLAPVVDPTGAHWPRWQRALSAGFGWPLASFRAWGAASSSDMGWVQRAGIREILLGGLTRPTSGAHGPDEHTTVEDLAALARSVLYYFASDFQPADVHLAQEMKA